MAANKRGVTIGQLAKAAGVNLETVRYYERIRLMPAPDRTEGGHRVYDADHVRRLAFIRRARELGFGVENIRALLAAAEPGHSSCTEVMEIAGAHLGEVRNKLADLGRLERILATTISQCAGDQTPTCPVLDMLDAARPIPPDPATPRRSPTQPDRPRRRAT